MPEILPDCMMPDGASPCRGYCELDAKLDAARQRIAELEERLEIRRAWQIGPDGKPVRVEVDFSLGSLDGIGCRDETIQLQDEQIDKLRARITRLDADLAGVLAGTHWIAPWDVTDAMCAVSDGYVEDWEKMREAYLSEQATDPVR